MSQRNICLALIVFAIGTLLISPYIFGNRKPVNAQLDSRKDGITVTFFNSLTATSTGELLSPAVDVAGFDFMYLHSMVIGSHNSPIVIQRSVDGITWFDGQNFSITSNPFVTSDIQSKYYRLKISNSVSGTTYYSKAYLKRTH